MLKDKPDLSRWSLKYNAFGQDIKYSWLARNLQARIIRIHHSNLDQCSLFLKLIVAFVCLFVCCSLLLIRKYIGDLLKVYLISKQVTDHKCSTFLLSSFFYIVVPNIWNLTNAEAVFGSFLKVLHRASYK